MPKKGKKRGKTQSPALIGNETPKKIVQRLLRAMEKHCALDEKLLPVALKRTLRNCIEDEALLVKFIVQSPTPRKPEDPALSIASLMNAVRQERYTHVRLLYVWDVPLIHEDLVSIALLLEKGVYPIKHIELLECLVEPYPLQRLALSFNSCPALTSIVLDYNEFGDDGCEGLCLGLRGNKTVLSVSLNYCALGVDSGTLLGHTLAHTALRELYLDGNDLECEGVIELVSSCVQQALIETIERQEVARRKAEEQSKESEQGSAVTTMVTKSGNEEQQNADKSAATPAKKGKKKGRRKKRKLPPQPPPVGPWLHKLHLVDNGIDSMGQGGSLALVSCVRMLARLVANSKCLQELDLDDNLIDNVGGSEILVALQDRKAAGLPSMKLRTTHRMRTETFSKILTLGAGLKKKKKRRAKKKKA